MRSTLHNHSTMKRERSHVRVQADVHTQMQRKKEVATLLRGYFKMQIAND